jgi:hypothetical protein
MRARACGLAGGDNRGSICERRYGTSTVELQKSIQLVIISPIDIRLIQYRPAIKYDCMGVKYVCERVRVCV